MDARDRASVRFDESDFAYLAERNARQLQSAQAYIQVLEAQVQHRLTQRNHLQAECRRLVSQRSDLYAKLFPTQEIVQAALAYHAQEIEGHILSKERQTIRREFSDAVCSYREAAGLSGVGQDA